MSVAENFKGSVDYGVSRRDISEPLKFTKIDEDDSLLFENSEGQGRKLLIRAVKDLLNPEVDTARYISPNGELTPLYEEGALEAAKKKHEDSRPRRENGGCSMSVLASPSCGG